MDVSTVSTCKIRFLKIMVDLQPESQLNVLLKKCPCTRTSYIRYSVLNDMTYRTASYVFQQEQLTGRKLSVDEESH